jgi:hypothetical protein
LFVAATMRMSTGISRLPPSRRTVRVSSARRSFTWMSGAISATSSRKIVPAVRLLERARLLVGRAGEGALLVAEQQVLEDLLRERGAVEGVERPLGAVALPVERARDELLAGAALAEDEHARHRRRDALDHLVDGAHLLALPDQLPVRRQPLELGLELAVLLLHRELREELGDLRLELAQPLGGQRLLDVVGGAGADGLDGHLGAALAGDHHELGRDLRSRMACSSAMPSTLGILRSARTSP